MIVPAVPEIVAGDRLPVLEPMDLLRDGDNAGDRKGLAHDHLPIAIVDGRRQLELCGLLAQVIGCSRKRRVIEFSGVIQCYKLTT